MKSIALIILASLAPQRKKAQAHTINDSYFTISKAHLRQLLERLYSNSNIIAELNFFLSMLIISGFTKVNQCLFRYFMALCKLKFAITNFKHG